jgi:hypothetical protein
LAEEPRATWDKRYKQRHYSYRDYHSVSTQLFPGGELQALAQAAADLLAGRTSTTVLYVFGTNARATINPYTLTLPSPQAYGATAWPENCYVREMLAHCSQDAWIKLVSVNPRYIEEATLQVMTKAAPTAPMLIFEREQFIPANTFFRFCPTYAYAIVFRADAVSGTLRIWAEGNVEGGE